jgi:hypothetical protein
MGAMHGTQGTHGTRDAPVAVREGGGRTGVSLERRHAIEFVAYSNCSFAQW